MNFDLLEKEIGMDLDPTTEFDFANLLADRLPQIKTSGARWRAFTDGCWREVQRDSFRPQSLEVLPPEKRTARRAKALLDHLEGRWQVSEENFRGALAFDENGAVLVNVANGVVRVGEYGIELFPHAEAHFFTSALAAEFVSDAKCDLFSETLSQCLPDEEDRELFQLCCGNFLLPDCRFEVCLVAYGEAGRGKSTVAEPIAAVLGDELVTRLSLSQLCDPRSYHLPKLRYAAVNLGTELDSLAVDESGNFKTLVSGEPVEARPIYGAPFTMRTTAKLWFLANGLPRFKNGTEAELRRTRFLRFDYKPAVPDVTLKGRLLAERNGVLNYMLLGLQKLLALPAIPLGGPQSREVHERFRISNDPIGAFVAARCHLEPEAEVRKESLCDAFTDFCHANNLSAALPEVFLKKLWERLPQINEIRRQVNGERLRVVRGMRLKATLCD